MTTTITFPSWFDDFKHRIVEGVGAAEELIQRTASIYLEAITRDPAFRDWIADELPQVPGSFWRNLERVARGSLDPRVATASCDHYGKLRRLPISEQRQALDGNLQLLTSTGDTLEVRLGVLMPKQAEQVFAADHIRSLAEQRAYLEARASESKKPCAKSVPAVEIDRKRRRIIVNGYPMSAADLADYLRKLSE